MSIVKIHPEFLENFSLEVTGKRVYSADVLDPVSGTYSSITGSVKLFPRRSSIEKETRGFSPFLDTFTREGHEFDVADYYREAKRLAVASGSNFEVARGILNKVNAIRSSERNDKQLQITRIETPSVLNRNFMTKRCIREQLFPYYRTLFPSAHWAYHNYNTLNFFETGSVPSDSVLMYPNLNPSASVAGNIYLPQGPFSFDFRINPRYTTLTGSESFDAGTLFHMSGVYALSLITGSSRDNEGLPDRYRIVLQVHSGTYTIPSQVTANANGIFISNDNVLKRNNWHHVVVRWGTTTQNFGTGSFVVDGEHAGTFVIPSSSLTTGIDVSPDILYVGNFYEGPYTGSNTQSRFFGTSAAQREGLTALQSDPSDGNLDAPVGHVFRHPLRAEVHELRIWNKYLAEHEIYSASLTSVTDMSDMLFYVPPFFTPESPRRIEVSSLGGVLQTPFFAVDGTTTDPFNVAMSFGVGALYLNLENFTRDFRRANYPRAYALTASQLNATSDVKTAVDFLYSTASVRKRNLTILPCDDGLFTPDYSLLITGTIVPVPLSGNINFAYANDLGSYDPSLVRLTELIPSMSYFGSMMHETGSLFEAMVGSTPDNSGVDPGEVLAIFQRTRDNSSNEVTIFDVSNMFYGNRIKPGTVKLYDESLTGSAGSVAITLRDNGYGSLYRADAETKHATWASVGNVLYDEGFIVVKSPHLPYYGREKHTIEFRGSQNIHTLKVRVPAAAGMHTSSSNPSFQPISASLAANEYDPRFVYLTGMHLHDENMNVLIKCTIAQPVIKRSGDKIVVKCSLDF